MNNDEKNNARNWAFIDERGSFSLPDPQRFSDLYFPLVNEAGMMSSITPTCHGDIKSGQNSFLTPPLSVEDLHNSRSARNFWFFVEGYGPWSATGNSARQIANTFSGSDEETVYLEAGFLWHKITRENRGIGLRAEVINFVPHSEDQVELMLVTLTNTSHQSLSITPTAAIPLFCRSADNLRDHRHVTSLLHRIHCHPFGVAVRPTLTFDERGHKPNTITYAVMGMEGDGNPPAGFFPIVAPFIGEGSCLEWPEAVVRQLPPFNKAGDNINGYEALGGIRFHSISLPPGDSKSYGLTLAILEREADIDKLVKDYGSRQKSSAWLEKTQLHWAENLDRLRLHTGEARFDLWMRWVAVQPTLRRLFGNSFLPYHDYGRGGFGWRDLWQDILALLLMESDHVTEQLYSNFAGVRFDGSNATIIGKKPGEFRADRNDIPRVWMDHGAWPLLTTKFYIDQTGDLNILLRDQFYFKDHLCHRAKLIDEDWTPDQGTLLRTNSGQPYRGTILEHLLVQHLVQFFNVGEHNIIRLEDADWNDGMDMAPGSGESVAFSALYAGNLQQLSELVLTLEEHGTTQIDMAVELMPLLDTLTKPVDYSSVSTKLKLLHAYFENCHSAIRGEKRQVATGDLAKDLRLKAEWLSNHIRDQEWIHNSEGYAWFNGYYNEDGERVEGDHPKGVRMTLTGQVFAIMAGVATDEHIREIVRAADRYLLDRQVGGYRLNTNFRETLLNLGRCFGFAFGHKENGAMFSHMAVMYANALYQRGFVREGYKILAGIYRHVQNFAVSRMYPGIPEYIEPRGRGVYPYLTGSSSWYLLTMVTQVFGIRGILGDLLLEPKLVRDQFDSFGEASISTQFAQRTLQVIYHNPDKLEYGEYQIKKTLLNGIPVENQQNTASVIIKREHFTALSNRERYRIDVLLGSI